MMKIESHPNYQKDQKSGAVINTDNTSLREYKITKMQSRKVYYLETKVDKLSSEISEIKQILLGMNNG